MFFAFVGNFYKWIVGTLRNIEKGLEFVSLLLLQMKKNSLLINLPHFVFVSVIKQIL